MGNTQTLPFAKEFAAVEEDLTTAQSAWVLYYCLDESWRHEAQQHGAATTHARDALRAVLQHSLPLCASPSAHSPKVRVVWMLNPALVSATNAALGDDKSATQSVTAKAKRLFAMIRAQHANGENGDHFMSHTSEEPAHSLRGGVEFSLVTNARRALNWLAHRPIDTLLPVQSVLPEWEITHSETPRFLCAMGRPQKICRPVRLTLPSLSGTEMLCGLADVADALCELHQCGWMHLALSWDAIYVVLPNQRWTLGDPHFMAPIDTLVQEAVPFSRCVSAAISLAQKHQTTSSDSGGETNPFGSLTNASLFVAPELLPEANPRQLRVDVAGGVGKPDVYAFGGILKSILSSTLMPTTSTMMNFSAESAERKRSALSSSESESVVATAAAIAELHRFAEACQHMDPARRPLMCHFSELAAVRQCTLRNVCEGLREFPSNNSEWRKYFFATLHAELYKIPYYMLRERVLPLLLRDELWEEPNAEPLLQQLVTPLSAPLSEWRSGDALIVPMPDERRARMKRMGVRFVSAPFVFTDMTHKRNKCTTSTSLKTLDPDVMGISIQSDPPLHLTMTSGNMRAEWESVYGVLKQEDFDTLVIPFVRHLCARGEPFKPMTMSLVLRTALSCAQGANSNFLHDPLACFVSRYMMHEDGAIALDAIRVVLCCAKMHGEIRTSDLCKFFELKEVAEHSVHPHVRRVSAILLLWCALRDPSMVATLLRVALVNALLPLDLQQDAIDNATRRALSSTGLAIVYQLLPLLSPADIGANVAPALMQLYSWSVDKGDSEESAAAIDEMLSESIGVEAVRSVTCGALAESVVLVLSKAYEKLATHAITRIHHEENNKEKAKCQSDNNDDTEDDEDVEEKGIWGEDKCGVLFPTFPACFTRSSSDGTVLPVEVTGQTLVLKVGGSYSMLQRAAKTTQGTNTDAMGYEPFFNFTDLDPIWNSTPLFLPQQLKEEASSRDARRPDLTPHPLACYLPSRCAGAGDGGPPHALISAETTYRRAAKGRRTHLPTPEPPDPTTASEHNHSPRTYVAPSVPLVEVPGLAKESKDVTPTDDLGMGNAVVSSFSLTRQQRVCDKPRDLCVAVVTAPKRSKRRVGNGGITARTPTTGETIVESASSSIPLPKQRAAPRQVVTYEDL